jgi:hypothetical protein
MKRKRNFAMSHWECILDYLDSLTLTRLATVCKLFSAREHENLEKCQDEINHVSKNLLENTWEKFEPTFDCIFRESTFQCCAYKNKIHKVRVENNTISVTHVIYK